MAKMSSTASTAASFAGDKPPSIRPTKSSSTEQSFHSCEQQSFYSCESHAASEKTPTPSQEDDQPPQPNNWIEVCAQCYWRDVADDHKEEDRRQGISRVPAKRAFLCMPNVIHPPSHCASRALRADELEGRTPLREYIEDTVQSEGDVFEKEEVENSEMIRDLKGILECSGAFMDGYSTLGIPIHENVKGAEAKFDRWVDRCLPDFGMSPKDCKAEK